MGGRLSILALEPYYGGSHRAFLDTLVRHSRHEFRLLTLPARKWKWRMRGAAIWFAQVLAEDRPRGVDLILTNDMLSVADLRALLAGGWGEVPLVCYFHENQLTYPLAEHAQRDFQYGFTNITSCLAADAVWFNSRFHLEAFLAAAAGLLRRMPDYVPEGILDEIRGRASVRYPLVEMDQSLTLQKRRRNAAEPLRILWNHRWEYDKNPEPFFEAVIRLDEAGHDFRLVIVGETFREAPAVFAGSWERLRAKLEQAGYVKSRSEYLASLAGCDVVVSTSVQENFGIAVLEAIAAGCQPLLPQRLSYPELIPERYHPICLYRSDEELPERLARLANDGQHECTGELRAAIVERFSAERSISAYDEAFEHVVEAAAGQRRP